MEFIRWPQRDQFEEISFQFNGFPSVLGINLWLRINHILHIKCVLWLIGVLDTTDIQIKQPLKNIAAYTNRKQITSVKLQVVCDKNMRIIDFSGPWPGSMHDARIFSLSSLSAVLDEKLVGTPYRIIADNGFGLRNRLMTPYRNNGHLTRVLRPLCT